MTNLEEAEKRIVELCERAEAELGWEFRAIDGAPGHCGCALQAAAVMMYGPGSKSAWRLAAKELGVGRTGCGFGIGFDRAALGANFCPENEREELGAKLARRFVHKEGVSK